METYLAGTHVLGLALVGASLGSPILVWIYRFCLRKTAFTTEQTYRLCLDAATVVPVAGLLWNLVVHFASNLPAMRMQAPPLTFEMATAAAGEVTVALTATVILMRLLGGIWRDVNA